MKEMIDAIKKNIQGLEEADIEKAETLQILKDYKEMLIDIFYSFQYLFEKIQEREEKREKQFEEIVKEKKRTKDFKYFS